MKQGGRYWRGLLAAVLMSAATLVAGAADASEIKLLSDDETELLLERIIRPLMQKAALPYHRGNIHIVEDGTLNAFVADGNHLFVNSGTLIKCDNVNELAGVIAHEIGHIKGGHILRQKLDIREMNRLSLVSAALAGAAGVISGRADAAMAVLMGGQSSALHQFMHYRANEERAADETAVKLLKAVGQSPKGIAAFMKKISKSNRLNGIEETPYFRTHPVTAERIAFFEKAAENSTGRTTSAEDGTYTKVRAKLDAYLGKPRNILKKYGNDNSLAGKYAKAIAYFKGLEFAKAQQIIGELLQAEPDNPYFYELKGQMEFETGKTVQAVKSFRQAYKLAPASADMQINLATALLEEKEDATNAAEAVGLIDKSLQNYPQAAFLWGLKARAEGVRQNMAAAHYAAAEYAYLLGDDKASETRIASALAAHPSAQLKVKLEDLRLRIKQDKKNR